MMLTHCFCSLISAVFFFVLCKHPCTRPFVNMNMNVFWYSSFLLLYELTYENEWVHEVEQASEKHLCRI